MKNENYISSLIRIIRYFKSKEQTPSKEEEDRIWNNILAEIQQTEQKKRVIRFRRLSWGAVAAAAILAGAVYLGGYHWKKESSDLLLAAYEQMAGMAEQESEEIHLLADDKPVTKVKNNAVIDYSQSDKQVKVDAEVIDKPADVHFHQLVVPRGKHTRLVLADGSMLHVNAGTKVVYPDRFEKGRREIFVDGEIYIDVTPDKESPFIVRTTSCEVEVLGTAFNVQAYSQDACAEVALVRGSVKLKDKHNGELLLKPDELARVASSEIKGKYKVDASDYAAWTEGLLKLKATPLSSVFKRLERYYGVEFSYSDAVGAMKMYGSLDLECPVEELLRRLEYTAPITFSGGVSGKYEISTISEK